ncbi:MAG: hypothetical protein Q8R76_11660 [Candidatus Omnitrophota bacterium]|nr:hypothetical protein [Candidatus Omnitrophota bacterium]
MSATIDKHRNRAKKMKWVKKGLIFELQSKLPWMTTHAAIPFADQDGDHCRVYFSARDKDGRAQIGFFGIDFRNPEKLIGVSEKPVLSLGSLGTFDDRGLTTSWIVNHGGRKYQYYSGWSLGVTVPFYLAIGLAVSDDRGKTFQKVSEGPILARSEKDPYLTASPCVLIENGIWRMWYVSGMKWELGSGKPKHYYHIRYAESRDGVHWDRRGVVCIDFKSPDEYAIARPCVLKDEDGYKMWYSYRGESYRIGYAESEDGIKWTRKDDEAGIDVSTAGWDSEMIEYPFVFDHGSKRYMLYNGNGYGKTGIGLAELAPPAPC